MPKAEKEFILNYAMNRWQLNFKKNVGPTSDSIRLCAPNSYEEWAEYYYIIVRSRGNIDSIGESLYQHIKNDLPGEERFHPTLLSSITKHDCISYMHNVVIDRVYSGYKKEHGM
ncbi:MAG: MjaI family restriction endonuclease [Clostridia bacterium]|nr:MjaI family restriction endonuclease [Clostridia bacterium]